MENESAPLISVIVPTYNRPERLKIALQSILNQTFEDFEIIVVNDAGSDIQDIVSSLNAKRSIVCIRHEINKGLSAARNTGIEAARGKYIAYLDDDDLFYRNHLSTLVEFLERHPGTIAYTDANCAFQKMIDGRWITLQRQVIYSKEWNNDEILIDNFVPVLCVMHEKSYLEKSGKFDESLNRHEDWDLWIRLSRHHHFVHIKNVTCEFTRRENKSSMTTQSFAPFLKTMARIHKKHADFAKKRPNILYAQTMKRLKLRWLVSRESGGVKFIVKRLWLRFKVISLNFFK